MNAIILVDLGLFHFYFYIQPKSLSPAFIVQHLYSSSVCIRWTSIDPKLPPPVPPILPCVVYHSAPSLPSIFGRLDAQPRSEKSISPQHLWATHLPGVRWALLSSSALSACNAAENFPLLSAGYEEA